jgi:hypothetical protein
MPGISKGSTIKFLLAENKCYAFSLSLSGTASALGTLAVITIWKANLQTKKIEIASPIGIRVKIHH